MDSVKHITFGKDKTAAIKGVAIIFMIVLHVFGGAGWYESYYKIPMNQNAPLINFMHSLQICVGIYVFMIGFGYYFSKNKDLKYSIIHIRKLLTVFWTILIIFAFPIGLKSMEGGEVFLLNLIGIREDISWVSWFVYLYLWSMIILPIVSRLIDNHTYSRSIIAIVICLLSMVAIHQLIPLYYNNSYWASLFVYLGWTPTILVGYVFAKKQIYRLLWLGNKWYIVPTALIVIGIVLYSKSRFPGISILNFDIIYSPIIIVCLLYIFSVLKSKFIISIFTELGDKSVYMWFIHALFFTQATRIFYQRFVMVSDNLWIIALWTIILSYLISIPLKKVLELR